MIFMFKKVWCRFFGSLPKSTKDPFAIRVHLFLSFCIFLCNLFHLHFLSLASYLICNSDVAADVYWYTAGYRGLCPTGRIEHGWAGTAIWFSTTPKIWKDCTPIRMKLILFRKALVNFLIDGWVCSRSDCVACCEGSRDIRSPVWALQQKLRLRKSKAPGSDHFSQISN